MTDTKKNDKCEMLKHLVIGSALTITSFIIIPSLIKKYGNKTYKKSLNMKDINFNDMQPEIIPFESENKEEK